MVDNKSEGRKRGRPRTFDPDQALDAAVGIFWRAGYDGADTASLANAMGLTKPSVYGAFGDKRSLFLKVLQRYSSTIGSEALTAFDAACGIEDAVTAFFSTVAQTQSGQKGARGCLIACVAVQCAETMPDVHAFLANNLQVGEEQIARRLKQSVEAGELPKEYPFQTRARLTIDLMFASAIRARAGASREEIERLAKENIKLVLAR